MVTWHITTPDDAAARTEALSLGKNPQVTSIGVSWSYGNGPAIVVVVTEDGVNMQQLTQYPATVLATTVTVPQPQTSEQEDAQVPSESEPEGENA